METVHLGPFVVPRIWTGLWQLSGNAWGSAPVSKIREAMKRHVDMGYTAFDMASGRTFSIAHVYLIDWIIYFIYVRVTYRPPQADHYGSAEIIFGQFRNSLSSESPRVIGATKWCVFRDITVDRETVKAAVSERLERMQTDRLDLLQFHWQDYTSKGYLETLEMLHDLQIEGVISSLGLCNFDTIRMDEICTQLGPGVIVSNQVQFSVIDTRPLHGMSDVCEKHDVKLLTYGTLCGGFLSDDWLGKPVPDPYSGTLTPSQRKYLDMIVNAWGDWELFQSLLRVLRDVGARHGAASISNVAVRWVLDHPFVGAVLIGARLGISEHIEDNYRVYGFSLTAEDNRDIEAVLDRSSGRRMVTTVGDCGAEYR